MIQAERKGESRNNHQFAAVVQDLAMRWIQSHPCETKTSQETKKNLRKFPEPSQKPEVIHTNDIRNLASIVKNFHGIIEQPDSSQVQREGITEKGCTSSKRRDISRIIAIWNLGGRYSDCLN